MTLISLKEAIKLIDGNYAIIRHYIKTNKIKRVGNLYDKQSIIDYIKSIEVVDLPNEIWKVPIGFTRYKCSNYGRIVSTKYKGGKRTRLINQAISGGYYKSVYINDNGKYCSISSHRLICLAFNYIDKWQEMQVNHIDGNKLNNNIYNLEWCTHQENIRHCVENKLQTPFKGEEVGNSKLKEWQVLEIRAKFKPRIYGRKKLAEEYNVSQYTIKEVVNRYTWKHI